MSTTNPTGPSGRSPERAAAPAEPDLGAPLAERDLACPICMSVVSDPFVTPCGHTFCAACIATHLDGGGAGACPCCARALTRDATYPNFLLSALVRRARAGALGAPAGGPEAVAAAVEAARGSLRPAECDRLVATLLEARREAEAREREGNMGLLLRFLQHSREDKARKLEALRRELTCLDADIVRVEATARSGGASPAPERAASLSAAPAAPAAAAVAPASGVDAPAMQRAALVASAAGPRAPHASANEAISAAPCGVESGGAPRAPSPLAAPPGEAAAAPPPPTADASPSPSPEDSDGGAGEPARGGKRRRLASRFEDLQEAYLRLRAAALRGDAGGAESSGGGAGAVPPGAAPAEARGGGGAAGAADVDDGLAEFSRMLSSLTRCSRLRLVAEIPRPSLRAASSIISSVEFDRDGGLFATAGVSKRISIFEHAAVVGSPGVAVHCPVVELVTRSKLSCLSWNRYVGAHLASSDYEGGLALWDVHASALVAEYEAHARRVWSVDFCAADPTLLASGSDDGCVKLWSTRAPGSLARLDLKANVCAVRWRPGSAHELAVGSADHAVYLYDLRRPDAPLAACAGHRRAVSYCRFVSSTELASASTDSTLRLWDLAGVPGVGAGEGRGAAPPPRALGAARVFEGHVNEKNFVGLAAEGGFLACGSEANEVVVYHKALSRPVARAAFGAGAPGGGERAFVSAVCWRPGTRELLAADSHGTVRVLQLTGSDE
jgi:E3 ubiquitin-protein ligase RFWD2